jgi:hypothetical protein
MLWLLGISYRKLKLFKKWTSPQVSMETKENLLAKKYNPKKCNEA